MTILAKIISNYDFKTPKVEMDIEGLGNEVIFFKSCIYSFQGPIYQYLEEKKNLRSNILEQVSLLSNKR
jgi:hypothetical protein